MRILLLLVVLGAMPAIAQEEELPPIAGTYVGEAYNGNDLDPVTTIFRFTPDGRLTGEYAIEDETGTFRGTISSVLFEGPRSISIEWTDRDGEGWARMDFSSGFNSFTGAWGRHGEEANMPWNGVRE